MEKKAASRWVVTETFWRSPAEKERYKGEYKQQGNILYREGQACLHFDLHFAELKKKEKKAESLELIS